MATKRREKNPFHSVKIGQGAAEHYIGLKGEQFSLLAQAAGEGCRVTKGANDRALGELHRLGLVRFSFPEVDGWPYCLALLTPTGAQALAQEPFGHASATVQ